MDTLNLRPSDLAARRQQAQSTRKTVEYLYATTALGLRVAGADATAHDPSLRWCLLEYRIDDDDVGRELSRYFSLSAPKAIIEARRALEDAKAVHLTDIVTLELDLDDAEQRWANACRQKLQALRVKLTDMCARMAPDAREVALPGRGVGETEIVANRQKLAPHYFIYLASGENAVTDDARVDLANVSQLSPSQQFQLRARNYIGGWLLEDDIEVDAADVALRGWPLPAFRRWIQGVAALRRKPPRDEGTAVPGDCVIAAGQGFCLVMDLPTFIARHLPQDK
ncbi:hypothetical protein [Burkholderia sp. Ac-20365]|uniref:hypothetical protein n=1 Tax=Burkholderia sp. Ac-20365 TaxID=2703897 RepID=UPI00197B47BD|nr:hypothetical protein [Burkholderia sp. Ac-20365]MBN3767477.1 hypothetical protein [Burkholderia sp. Ac-20365]